MADTKKKAPKKVKRDIPSVNMVVEPAKMFNKKFAGKYTAIEKLNLYSGVGTSKSILVEVPGGSMLECYGFYTPVNGTKWYLVEYKNHSGFVSSKLIR